MSIVITGRVANKMSKEDSGAALIADLDETTTVPDDESFFVRLQSWNDSTFRHETLESLRGKQVRITIETLD
jgi:hypothetical protein